MRDVLERLAQVVQSLHPDLGPGEDILRLVDQVIDDTRTTLFQLHQSIKKLLPGGRNVAGELGLTIRLKFMYHGAAFRATLERLKARKDALNLILNLWARFCTISLLLMTSISS